MQPTWMHRALVRIGLATLTVVTFAPTPVHAQATDDLRQELKGMKAQIKELQDKVKRQEQVIDKLSAQAAAPATATAVKDDQEKLAKEVTEAVVDKIQPSLTAANKTFPSQFNPAIGFFIDTVGSYKDRERGNFEFRSGELGIAANVDPFTRGFAILNGTSDGVQVEEAGIVTTALPYNLTVKGGRFFSDFGRFSKFHDHDLPFVNRPLVLDRFVQGESKSDGVEVSYLAPLPQYLTLTLGAYNKIGADNTRVDNSVPRDFSKFTYLARPATFFGINDANSIDLGMSYAYTPKVDTFTTAAVEQLRDGKPRHLAAVDFTYRYTPLSQASYRGLIWGTEVLYNREDPNVGSNDEPLFHRTDAFGLYSYLEARLSRRFYPGFLFDYVQDIKRQAGDSKSYSPYLTIWASEFQRLRLQYTYLDEPLNQQNQFFAQWTVIMGSHVHGFRDR